jgi:beta-N-acetylhexosaminidase
MKAPRALIVGLEGPALLEGERAFLSAARPWGVILFGRNVRDPAQMRALCHAIRDAAGWHIPILIDQEGGRVQRLGPPHWAVFPLALDQALTAQDPQRAMWLRGRLLAADLTELGIDVNCAPVADIAGPDTHAILRNRCLGMDVDMVARHARALADGLVAGGVLPVLKHIPGHGRALVDSHLDLPRVDTDIATLHATDFAPFRTLNDLPLGMTAHLLFTALDDTRPATQSPTMIDLIRNQIGFQGMLMTDDISMQALSGSVTGRAQAALAAGCDLILHCNGILSEMRALAEICPLLDGVALARHDRVMAARKHPDEYDLDAMRAEFAALVRMPAA